MSLIVLQVIRKLALVAQHCIVDEWDTCDPVALFQFAIALKVILTSCKVPHEVAPVHEVTLVREEESDVLPLCRHIDSHSLTAAIVIHRVCANAAHPVLISLFMSGIVHTWEEHILRIYV